MCAKRLGYQPQVNFPKFFFYLQKKIFENALIDLVFLRVFPWQDFYVLLGEAKCMNESGI